MEKKALLDPRSDYLFKRIFGSEENRDVLLAFLNRIFEAAGQPLWKEIVLVNPYTQKDTPTDKQSIMDVKGKAEDGRLVDLEMQLYDPYHMPQRTLFYWGKLYTQQLKEAGKYHELKKCIAINILNFNILDRGQKQAHHVFHLREDRTLSRLTDDIEIHIIELPKVEEQMDAEDGLSNWLLFLKDANQLDREALKMQEPMLEKAMNTLEQMSQDEQIRMEHEARMKFQRDMWSIEHVGMEKGLQEGRAEGRAEGRKEGVEEGVRRSIEKMLSKGNSVEDVADMLDLSVDEVCRLRDLSKQEAVD